MRNSIRDSQKVRIIGGSWVEGGGNTELLLCCEAFKKCCQQQHMWDCCFYDCRIFGSNSFRGKHSHTHHDWRAAESEFCWFPDDKAGKKKFLLPNVEMRAHQAVYNIYFPGKNAKSQGVLKGNETSEFWLFSFFFLVKCVRDFFLFCREEDIVLSWQQKKKASPKMTDGIWCFQQWWKMKSCEFFVGALKASCDEVWRCVDGTERDFSERD